MDIGELIKAGMFLFAVIMGLYFGLSIAFAPTPEAGSEKLAEAVTYYAIPWQVKAIQFFASLSVPLATIGILGVIGYMIYSKYFS